MALQKESASSPEQRRREEREGFVRYGCCISLIGDYVTKRQPSLEDREGKNCVRIEEKEIERKD